MCKMSQKLYIRKKCKYQFYWTTAVSTDNKVPVSSDYNKTVTLACYGYKCYKNYLCIKESEMLNYFIIIHVIS